MRKERYTNLLVYLSFLLVVFAVIGEIGLWFYIFKYSNVEILVNKNNSNIAISKHKITSPSYTYSYPQSIHGNKAEMLIPAVDSYGNGTIATLIVEARPGSGKSLVNIDNLLFWTDTQHSIRIARKVAEHYLNKSLDNIDLIYTIKANATVIEGPSAGAAITIATIAALENKSLRRDVTITGTINSDGSIGPVGGVLQKGKAAASHGIKTFLVPLGQSYAVEYIPQRHCEKYGFVTYCETEVIPKRKSISEVTNLNVREVQNIAEALKYFLIE